MSKILFISATHGNESFSIPVIRSLEKKYLRGKYGYDWIIGNPKALKRNIRFTEVDLNRSAPGNLKSALYEERRARQLVDLSKKYRFLIDIHGTDSGSGIFVLVTNPTLENLLLAASIPIKNVVIWAAKSSLAKGPLTQYVKCPAVEIECGPKSSKKISKWLETVVEDIIKKPSPDLREIIDNIPRQKYFIVYGKEENINTRQMQDFKKTKIKEEEFYPLLVDAYQKGSTRKMKKLNLFDLLSY